MKLDPTLIRYIDKDTFRVLTAVEMGMKNHEYVPSELIANIAGLKHGGAYKHLGELCKFKLVHHTSLGYDGYSLTFLGYDFLALKTLANRGIIASVGRQIGVGKESDIFVVQNSEGREMALKLHRLGRISFRQIKNKRDYLLKRKSASWLYMSRLASLKEYAYMKVLYDNGFPVPEPIDHNRHCVVMELINGHPFSQISELAHPGKVYSDCMNIIVKLAQYGLIHCDFNEFNLLVKDDETVIMIDFPQMISTSHYNAETYFQRDVQCIITFFARRFNYFAAEFPKLDETGVRIQNLDLQVMASGFSREDHAKFEVMMSEGGVRDRTEGGDVEEDDDGAEWEDSYEDSQESGGEGVEEDDGVVEGTLSARGEGGEKVESDKAADNHDRDESDESEDGDDSTLRDLAASSRKSNQLRALRGDAAVVITKGKEPLSAGSDSNGSTSVRGGEGGVDLGGDGTMDAAEAVAGAALSVLESNDHNDDDDDERGDGHGGANDDSEREGEDGGERRGGQGGTEKKGPPTRRKVKKTVDFRMGGEVSEKDKKKLIAKKKRLYKRNNNKSKTARDDASAIRHYDTSGFF